jgi:hypothetical protein
MPNPRSRHSRGKLLCPVSMRGLGKSADRTKKSKVTEIRISVDFSGCQKSRDAWDN